MGKGKSQIMACEIFLFSIRGLSERFFRKWSWSALTQTKRLLFFRRGELLAKDEEYFNEISTYALTPTTEGWRYSTMNKQRNTHTPIFIIETPMNFFIRSYGWFILPNTPLVYRQSIRIFSRMSIPWIPAPVIPWQLTATMVKDSAQIIWSEPIDEKEFNKCIKHQKKKDARLSRPHGNKRGKAGLEQKKGKG